MKLIKQLIVVLVLSSNFCTIMAGECIEVKRYQASDGTEYNTLNGCQEYQKKLDFYEELHNKIGEIERQRIYSSWQNGNNEIAKPREFGYLKLTQVLDFLNKKGLKLQIIKKEEE